MIKKIISYFNLNYFINLITFLIILICLINKEGIIFNIIELYQSKNSIKQQIVLIKKEIEIQKYKITLLNMQNQELLEIINYKFKKKIPYSEFIILYKK